ARDDSLATVTGWIAPAALRALAAAPGVRSASEVLTPMTATDPAGTGPGATDTSLAAAACSPVVDEADTQLKAARARSTYGVDGTGVTVGVLSDSYDRDTADTRSAAQDVASGDLPGAANPCGRTSNVRVLDDSASGGGADEGRAMLQHVHDLAPGSQLAFATAFNGLTSFAANIKALANIGAKVISDDVTYFNEPFFQQGPVDAAIATVKAQGVNFFSSAANNNTRVNGLDVGSYEAPAFRPSTTCGAGLGCHDFNAGTAVDNSYGYAVPAGSAVAIDLQWDQPWYGVTTDLDILLTDAQGNVIASSTNDNRTTQQPYEFVRWANTTGVDTAVFAFIVKVAGSANPRLKTVEFGNGARISDVEYRKPTGNDIVGPQIFGHNGGPNVVSMAAVPYNDSTRPETFSSPGPVTLYHGPVKGTTPAPALATKQKLAKPDVAATDGAATTFFAQLVGSTWRFYGTSAASPHAAAVAALVRDADPTLTPSQVASLLRSTASSIANGTVKRTGAGLVNALKAVAGATG
ncbi:S8 family peptidase, partial [Jatrophihabitans sp. YIM 134969]